MLIQLNSKTTIEVVPTSTEGGAVLKIDSKSAGKIELILTRPQLLQLGGQLIEVIWPKK